MIEKSRKIQANPAFTSSVSGSVFFAPGDIKVAYGINTLIGAGDTGTGQSIAIMGQSSIVASDIENFETAAGLPVKDPNQILVPGTGAAQAFAGDEGESDLDIEWSGGIAPEPKSSLSTPAATPRTPSAFSTRSLTQSTRKSATSSA
jgi:subtilase family serine protease